MAKVTLKGNTITTSGELPAVGTKAGDFSLIGADLSEKNLADYAGQRKILNIFPSVDTGTCAASVRRFNQEAAQLKNTVVLCVSKDLPFAQKRFCAAEGIENVSSLSAFRSSFASDYGLEILDSGLKGLCSRAIVILDENNTVVYTEQVAETTEEPNYDAALNALKVVA
jgi:thioredoxin-dependent peroxiredoxin